MKKSQLLALLLAFTMLISLAACSKNTSSSGEKQSAVRSDTSNYGTQNDQGEKQKEPVTFSCFINLSWYPIDKYEGILPETTKEATGVTLNITRAADDKQLPVMIASGDLMDLTYTDNTGSVLSRLSDPKLCLPFDELIPKYSSDFDVPKGSEKNAKSFSQDNHYYTILNGFTPKEEWDKYPLALPTLGTSGLAVRQDILDKMGNPSINSTEDLYNVLLEVKQKYPDMMPMVINTTLLYSTYSYFANQFGAVSDTSGFSTTVDDKLIYRIRTPQYKNYLKYMNKLYRSGLISADNFAFKDETPAEQLVRNGTAFSYCWVSRAADEMNGKVDPGKGIKFTQVISPLTKDVKYLDSTIGWAGIFISKDCKAPDRAIQFLKYLFSEKGQRASYWGREGIDYDLSPDGYPVWKNDMKKARGNMDILNLKYNYWINFGFGGIVEGLMQDDENLYPQTKKYGLQIRKITTYNSKMGLVNSIAGTEEDTIKNTIRELVKQYEIEAILSNSEEECLEIYKEMIKTADEQGLKKYEEWGNKKYTEVKAK